MRVVKIPVTYEAYQWNTYTAEEVEKALEGTEAMLSGAVLVWHSDGRDFQPRKIKRLYPGDWIVVGSDGSVKLFSEGEFFYKYRIETFE